MEPTIETEFKTQSDTISKIALALSKAQSKMAAAKKTANNPFFNSTYADLNSVWEAIRPQLAEHELAVVQTPTEDSHGTAIITTLAHSSGEWFRSKLYITPKAKDAQSVGSAITYARRYALSAITGIAPDDDDDGNKAVRPVSMSGAKQPEAKKEAAPAAEAPGEEKVTFDVARQIDEIQQMLASMNASDADSMDAHLKTLTKWTPKGTTEEKFLQMADLPNIAKRKPDWFKGVHKKVSEEYKKAQDAEGKAV